MRSSAIINEETRSCSFALIYCKWEKEKNRYKIVRDDECSETLTLSIKVIVKISEQHLTFGSNTKIKYRAINFILHFDNLRLSWIFEQLPVSTFDTRKMFFNFLQRFVFRLRQVSVQKYCPEQRNHSVQYERTTFSSTVSEYRVRFHGHKYK